MKKFPKHLKSIILMMVSFIAHEQTEGVTTHNINTGGNLSITTKMDYIVVGNGSPTANIISINTASSYTNTVILSNVIVNATSSSAMIIANNSKVKVVVAPTSSNTLATSFQTGCGIQVESNNTAVAELILEGSGILVAQNMSSTVSGAGIGGRGNISGNAYSAGKITIGGSVQLIAISEDGGGIGGGRSEPLGGGGGIVIIKDDAIVTARSAWGAGIGGGCGWNTGGRGGIVNISGSTTVNASSYAGSGIGGGYTAYTGGIGGTVTISGTARVTAVSYVGAGIGGGGSPSGANGGTVTITDSANVIAIAKQGAGIGGGSNGSGAILTISPTASVIATSSAKDGIQPTSFYGTALMAKYDYSRPITSTLLKLNGQVLATLPPALHSYYSIVFSGSYVANDTQLRLRCNGIAQSGKLNGTGEETMNFQIVPNSIVSYSYVKDIYPTCALSFDANGGTVTPTSKAVTHASAYGILPEALKDGYNFAGWWTMVVDGVRVTQDSIVYEVDNHSLYARWTPKTYMVTLNPNGGTGGSSSVMATYDQSMPTAVAPSREGYIFNGYHDLPEGGNRYYTSSMASSTNWTHTTELILYAQWVARGTIRFQKSAYGVSENNELGLAALKVERVSGSYGSASVTFEVMPDTATPEEDYSATPYTLTWNNGQTGTRNLTIDIYDDDLVEGNESFTVRLINVTGALLGEPNEALLTIVDNETADSRIVRIEGANVSGILDFGNVATNASASRTIYIWNDGNQPLSVTNVTAVTGFSASQSTFTVEAGSMFQLVLTFTPSLIQNYSGTLSLFCIDSTGTSSITLNGVGVEPPPTVARRTITGLTAIIAVDVSSNATVLAVEDTLPAGLFPVSISDKGSWDSVNRKVKWFFDKKVDIRDRALQYKVNVLGTVVGGLVNFGTDNIPIVGDTVFQTEGDPGVLHPADTDGDWRLTIDEVAAHITRWSQGLEDVKTAYAIRAITVYLCGEEYVYDGSIPPGAKRWIPALSPSPAFAILASPENQPIALSDAPITASAIRQIVSTNVFISVTPVSGTMAYGMEEAIPDGASVANISDDGVWDSNNRKIKWSFDDSQTRTLSYSVNAQEGTNVTLTGMVSFDGSEDPITGQLGMTMPVTFNTWALSKGLPTGDLNGLFNSPSAISGVAYGFEYAFGTNVQSTTLLNILYVNGRFVVETPAQDEVTAPYVNISVLGSTNLFDWTLSTLPATETTGKPANRIWYEPADTHEKAFFKLGVELK